MKVHKKNSSYLNMEHIFSIKRTNFMGSYHCISNLFRIFAQEI